MFLQKLLKNTKGYRYLCKSVHHDSLPLGLCWFTYLISCYTEFINYNSMVLVNALARKNIHIKATVSLEGLIT